MKRFDYGRALLLAVGSSACLVLGMVLLSAQNAATGGQAKAAPANTYIGQAKCKACHSTAATGDQHGQWMKTSHAQAFKRLASDEAKKIAAEKGIADPQKDPACFKCHVTAHDAKPELIKKGFELADGVQCETCHGPGGNHVKARFAAAAEASSTAPVAIPAGEIIANPGEATCRGCHNKESPTFKRFCYPEFYAKISHENPKKARTDAERAHAACGCGDACGCVEKCMEGCASESGAPKEEKPAEEKPKDG